MKGQELLGLRYEPPFDYLTDYGERGHTVLAGDFVSLEDGTGVVHTGGGLRRGRLPRGRENGVTVHNPVLPDGTFDDRMGEFAGVHVRDADARVSSPLPSATACSVRALPALVSALLALRHAAHLLREALVVREDDRRQRRAGCEQPGINWHPDHIKDGRLGKWLEGNVDWALSRDRYWGTPLPVWRCTADTEHVHCIGSRAELSG